MMRLSARQQPRPLGQAAARQHHTAVVNPQAATAAAVSPVVGFAAVTDEREQQLSISDLLDAAGVVTLKERVMEAAAFKAFQQSVERKPALQSDWLSFTSRPWVQGPVDAFLGNTHLAAMMSQHSELAATVEGLVTTLDTALTQGGHLPWLLHVVQHCAGHSGMYVIMQAVEEMLGPHHIARLERLTYAALTRPRAVKLMAVLVALLTPEVVEGLMQLLKALLTDERLTRLMDAAEYVVSDDDRMSLAALALDSLSDAVSDESILHLIATLDTEADLQLIVHTGQEVLEVLLSDPVAMGQRIGSLVDAVADLKRLERTVSRNDEVMTLERIAVLHKVLAQVSPAGNPHNVTAAVSTLRTALTSHSAHAWLSAAGAAAPVGELRAWWQAFDAVLTSAHIQALLDAVEALLDGGRVWALLGQPQPALEMLLVADEEARAATCRSRCGSTGDAPAAAAAAAAAVGDGSSGGHSDGNVSGRVTSPSGRAAGRFSLSSRDEWVLSSMGSMDDIGTASASSSAGVSGGSLSAAAAAAAAAATAAAEAAAVAPSCALDDRDCQDCSGRCGSPVERAFASGDKLTDPDLTALIRAALRDIRPYRLAKQRAAAQANAQQAVTTAAGMAAAAAAAAAGAGSSSGHHFGSSSGDHGSSSFDDWASSSSSILASLDMVGRYAPGSPLASMHLGTEALPTDAHQNAGTAAAAAVAVAAAAAASQGGTCSFASMPSRDLTPPVMGAAATGAVSDSSSTKGAGSSSSSSSTAGARYVHAAVAGAASVARAAFKPRRMRSFFDLATELLAPQRVAIAMAVLDDVLRIGQHSVAVGPVCELNSPAASTGSNTSGGSSSSSSSGGGAQAALTAAGALLAAVPGVVSQRLVDAAVGAAADVASGRRSRRTVLHAADTVLALATVQQEMQLFQQQQQVWAMSSSTAAAAAAAAVPAAPAAAADPHKQLEAAAAVMHCALGDPHSCVAAEELSAAAAAAAAAGGNAGHVGAVAGGSSSGARWQQLATVVGLHVSLAKDLGQLWWAYHTRLALHLGGSRA